jgi:REP element-mobilizing transposase RayT
MARRLRIQYPGAVYHVINRGNYREDVFATGGAAKAFEQVLEAACVQFDWHLQAYVVMRNHFHLALETPQPNLVEGMHWLQSTYATRFNRLRSERGHLFQGRYQALLIEDDAALARVVDYIHLNPVRAKIVSTDQIAHFRWSSLARFVRRERPAQLSSKRWLEQRGLTDTPAGWRDYVGHLNELGSLDASSDHDELCRGWAIGTPGWRKALAEDHAQLAAAPGFSVAEIRDLRHAVWSRALDEVLSEMDKSEAGAREEAKGADWKCEAAVRLRQRAGAPYAWIADRLHMGRPASVRSLVCRRRSATVVQPCTT